ncbi:MAG: hypothetical protein ABGX27_03880 [Desulfurobacteriaceae bacterium]
MHRFLDAIYIGKLPKGTLKDINKELKKTKNIEKKLKTLKEFLSNYYLEEIEKVEPESGSPVEVILSQYFGYCY